MLVEIFENGEWAAKLTSDHGVGIQTIHDNEQKKMQLLGFIRDCDSSTGPSAVVV
jgi:hypothetical protein